MRKYWKVVIWNFIIFFFFSFDLSANESNEGDINAQLCDENSLYVSNDHDVSYGKYQFDNLNSALSYIRNNKAYITNNAIICLTGGEFFVSKSINLSKYKSDKNKLIITSFRGKKSVITSAIKLKIGDFHKIKKSSKYWKLFNKKYINNIFYLNLNDIKGGGNKSIKIEDINLVINDVFTYPARWPNENIGIYNKKKFFLKDNTLKNLIKMGFSPLNIKNDVINLPRNKKWKQVGDIYVNGFFKNYWYYEILKSKFINEKLTLINDPKYGIEEGMPIFFSNIPEELDQIQEFYYSESENKIYFLLNNPEKDDIHLSISNHPVFIAKNTNDIIFKNIEIKYNSGVFFDFKNVNKTKISNLNLSYTNSDAIRLLGKDNVIEYNKISNVGWSGIVVNGGDRSLLKRSNNIIKNNEIYNFSYIKKTYTPGVKVSGVGNYIINNYIHHSPHSAIIFTGNDNIIEGNLIEDVVKISNDSGAIYTGRDLGYRGNVIKNNLINNINGIFGWTNGVYLDDGVSGVSVLGNILSNINGYSVVNGGGRDNKIEKNIMYNIRDGFLYTDRRIHKKINNKFIDGEKPDSWNLIGRLKVDYLSKNNKKINFKEKPWSNKYPELAKYPSNYKKVEKNRHWLEPEGTTFKDNIAIGDSVLIKNGTWGGRNSSYFFKSISNNIKLSIKEVGVIYKSSDIINNRKLMKWYALNNIDVDKISTAN